MSAAYYKYIIGHLLSPPSLLIVLLIFSTLLILLNRWVRFAKWLLASATFTLYFFSTNFGADLVLSPLEFKYPKYQQQPQRTIKYIIVLGCAKEDAAFLPQSSILRGCSHIRLREGYDIYRQNPGSHLILTGGGLWREDPIAASMRDSIYGLGVNPQDVTAITYAVNTEHESIKASEIIGDSTAVLVTSAAHMPRAMSLFERQGAKLIPAPTDYLVREIADQPRVRYFIPEVVNLAKVRSAFHEYYGMLWLKLKN